LCY
jgi:paired box protein 3/7